MSNTKAEALLKQQSTATLMQSLAHLEEIAPEPDHAEMPEWCRMTRWIEEELIERLGCRDAHTEWVLSDDFGSNGERTSYAFLAKVGGN